jgi:hypothetical protein
MGDETNAKSTDRYESTEDAALDKLSQRLLKPAGCRGYLRRRLAKVFPEIVDGFLEEAKKGGCVHLKMATELLQPTRQRASRRKGSVAKLLEELRGVRTPGQG